MPEDTGEYRGPERRRYGRRHEPDNGLHDEIVAAVSLGIQEGMRRGEQRGEKNGSNGLNSKLKAWQTSAAGMLATLALMGILGRVLGISIHTDSNKIDETIATAEALTNRVAALEQRQQNTNDAVEEMHTQLLQLNCAAERRASRGREPDFCFRYRLSADSNRGDFNGRTAGHLSTVRSTWSDRVVTDHRATEARQDRGLVSEDVGIRPLPGHGGGSGVGAGSRAAIRGRPGAVRGAVVRDIRSNL